MECSKCSFELLPDTVFCAQCGIKVTRNHHFCTECGVAATPETKFCQNCGKQVNCQKDNNDISKNQYGKPGNNDFLSLWEYFIKCFKLYATFDGRARRAEYWGFSLFTLIFSIVGSLFIVGGILVFIVTFIPSISVLVRRLHDINKSGSLAFLYLLPIIGWIILIVLCCTEGDRGTNKYGPDPKDY